MQKTKLTIIFSAIIFFTFFALAKSAEAERFFQQNSTWYEEIPANPAITPNSTDYIADILFDSESFAASYHEWSIPIFYAEVDTPITTVPVTNLYQKDWIESNEWNKVPIPNGALPAGNTAYCAGQYRDGAMAVISHDRTTSWEFFGAKYCNGEWLAKQIRKWDLTGDGVNSPYDGHVVNRAAAVPLIHGVVTYDEVVNDGVIDHALVFLYWADPKDKWPNGNYRYNGGVYPSAGLSRAGLSDRTWAMQLGMRLQLDPAFDCNTITNYPLEKMVCIAAQTYGMIFVDSPGQGNAHHIQLEDLTNKSQSWSGIYTAGFSNIPFNSMRVVDPIYPSVSDTAAPSVPTNITATAVSSTQINLAWTASTDSVGVTGYKVYRNGSQIATVTTTSYSNTGLAASTAYTYTVSAYDAAGNISAQSAEVSATTNSDAVAPVAPSGLSVQ